MRLLLVSILLFVLSLATLSCQKYSAGLQKSTNRAGETSAIATLRTIAQAQTTYSISNPGDYGTFEQLAAGGFLDTRFNRNNPEFYGYVFTMQVSPQSEAKPSSYSCNADPAPAANIAGRHFYIDSNSQDTRVNATQPATATDEVLRP